MKFNLVMKRWVGPERYDTIIIYENAEDKKVDNRKTSVHRLHCATFQQFTFGS